MKPRLAPPPPATLSSPPPRSCHPAPSFPSRPAAEASLPAEQPAPDPAAFDFTRLKVWLATFGCQMNKYDSERIAGQLAARGARFVSAESEANLLLFNTCSVRAHAEERVRGRLGSLRERKRRNPELLIAVVGCMAQKEAAELAASFPFVDLIVGTRRLDALPELLPRLHAGAAPRPWVAVEVGGEVDFGATPARRSSRVCALLTVARGCDKRCAYCVVPGTRGRERSRTAAEILAEARRLSEEGAREITLLGQTIDTYGRDLGLADGLPRLLEDLAGLPGLLRLRFLTNHPAECRDSLWRAMHELREKVMPFVHMPAQSGSDAVLRRMNRGYTRDEYRRKLDEARRFCPEIEIVSDWIVGFCGEQEEDFIATLNLLEEGRFQSGFFFTYSPRPGTPAADWPDDVPEAVKRERHRRLLEAQARLSLARNRARIGGCEEVLVEGPSKRNAGRLTGRARAGRLVHFPGPADLAGRLARVRICDASALVLIGAAAEDGVAEAGSPATPRREARGV